MSRHRLLKRDERGAAAIEFAIAVPVLILFIWGIFQIGLLMQAHAGMQHALGEGARYATLYVEGAPQRRPSDAQIKTRIEQKVFRPKVGTFTVANPTTTGGYKNLSVTYQMPMDFLFFPGPTVNITRTKRVYVVI